MFLEKTSLHTTKCIVVSVSYDIITLILPRSVRERYGSTLLPATREQHDQTVHKVINKGLKTYV